MSHATRAGIERLLAVMARLRDPEHGCAWDIEQTFDSIAPYTIEEAYEVADAIERGDWGDLKGEIGDLLLQVVYYAQMGRERGLFDFDGIASAIADKMIRRHPHVFGATTAEPGAIAGRQAQERWEAVKAEERAARAAEQGVAPSLMDNVPVNLPSLTRALKLQKRAARAGFDWPDLPPIRAKIAEELAELDAETGACAAPDRIEDELGDLLFCVVNYARRLGIDPETALRRGNRKFEARFREMETISDRELSEMSLDQLEELWRRAKAAHGAAGQ